MTGGSRWDSGSAQVARLWSQVKRLPSHVSAPGSIKPAELWRRLVGLMPPEILDELKVSGRRLATVRRPRDLVAALETEVARLSSVVVPILARHPLPVWRRGSAEVFAAATAGAAAALVELDEIAVLFTEGAATPTVPAAGASLLVAFVVEVWIATSLRVHQIEESGRKVDMDALVSEVNSALLGVDMSHIKDVSGHVASAVGKRVARRWAGALAPGVGIVIDGVAARRTVAAIAAMPLVTHPTADTAPASSEDEASAQA